jgi:hypothetical protein
MKSIKPIEGDNIVVEIDENKHHRSHLIIVIQVKERDKLTLAPLLVLSFILCSF